MTNRPYPPEVIRRKLAATARKHAGRTASPKQRGLCAGMLNACFDTDEDARRHSLLRYLFGPESLNDLMDQEVLALLDWLKPDKIDGEWLVSEHVQAEARLIFRAAMVSAGQTEMEL